MSEYIYEISGYKVGVDKSNQKDEIALSIIKQIDDKIIVLGSCRGAMAGFIDLIIKENTYLKENSIPKQWVERLIKELNNEYIKQEEIFNKHFEKENRDMQDYYIQKEATNTMQEISWLEGNLEELLEKK